MDTRSGIHVPGRNRLLELLPQSDRARVLANMERIEGKLGAVVFERDKPLDYVDFPLCAVISVVIIMEDGAIAEAGTIAAGMLQKAGFIRYHRGVITVLDRAGLEESACECHRVVRSELERLLS